MVAESRPELLDRRIETKLRIDKRVRPPELLLQLLPRHQLPWARQKHRQNVEGLFLKTNFPTLDTKLARLQIELKGPDPHAVWAEGQGARQDVPGGGCQ